MIAPEQTILGIIGLGYVGLPLAVAFGNHIPTFGFDIDLNRIRSLEKRIDQTFEVSTDELLASKNLSVTNELEKLSVCNAYIATVPTPIDANRNPDLGPLRKASEAIGSLLKKGDVVIFESTVYPGATEEVCVPLLEQVSSLKLNRDFFVGYSPERINPGDKNHRLKDIVKVTAGSSEKCANFIASLYGGIIDAGIHKASSIKVAEAAKVIENTQRDLNIALMNELAIIFKRMNLDTNEVLEAAGTKWNFLPFRPGLVGGHCIGVDPYYLTHKAEALGYHPEVILAGRRINDRMGEYIVGQIAKLMNGRKKFLSGSKTLILGLTFKEDCPDLRNSRVFDIIDELLTYGAAVSVYDPWVAELSNKPSRNFELVSEPAQGKYDAIILAVGHKAFKSIGIDALKGFGQSDCVIYDVKSLFEKEDVDERL